ncbi:MAG: hypothetical protein SNH73_06515 [Rikenellaceae bacterium]
MEDRKLNEKESLELITRMMQNTKMNLEVGSGNGLIIWGVSILMTNIIVFLLLYFTQSPMSYWAWMTLPIIGMVWTKIAEDGRPKVTTKVDKMVTSLSNIILVMTVMLPFAFWILATQMEQSILLLPGYKLMSLIPFAEMLIVSIGLIANAIIIDFKPLKIGGAVGAMLSLLLLCATTSTQAYIFCTWAIASMVIPGIKLNSYIKSKKNV